MAVRDDAPGPVDDLHTIPAEPTERPLLIHRDGRGIHDRQSVVVQPLGIRRGDAIARAEHQPAAASPEVSPDSTCRPSIDASVCFISSSVRGPWRLSCRRDDLEKQLSMVVAGMGMKQGTAHRYGSVE